MDTQFSITWHNDTPIIKITGDLDHITVPKLKSLVQKFENEGRTKVIIDMSSVEFLDSGGISGIIFACKRLNAAGGHLFLAGCNPRIIRKLDIGGFTKIPELLSICITLEEALTDIDK